MAMLLSACSTMTAPDLSLLQHQVFAAEHAFARGKAERKFDDFVRLLSEQAGLLRQPRCAALQGRCGRALEALPC